MVKTQIQVPDELYKRAKQIAKEKEWSLAEVFRRGLEYMDETNPPPSKEVWKLPVIKDRGYKPKSIEELNAIIDKERDEQVLERVGL